jgi:hypothetical protein
LRHSHFEKVLKIDPSYLSLTLSLDKERGAEGRSEKQLVKNA